MSAFKDALFLRFGFPESSRQVPAGDRPYARIFDAVKSPWNIFIRNNGRRCFCYWVDGLVIKWKFVNSIQNIC